MNAEIETIIIGGGPAGLSAAWALKRLGVNALVLEAGPEVGWSWRCMPRKISLLSPWKVNCLPGTVVEWKDRHKLHKCSEYADYLREYVNEHELTVRCSSPVSSVLRNGKGFVISGEEFELKAKSVVSATGYFRNPNMPTYPGMQASEIFQTHVSAYGSAGELIDTIGIESPRVLVVGRRISAGQTIEDLHEESAKVSISCRGPIEFAWEPWILKLAFHFYYVYEDWRVKRNPRFMSNSYPPMEAGQSKRLIRSGKVTVFPDIAEVKQASVRFADGREQEFDAIIYATGFKPVSSHLSEVATDLSDAASLRKQASEGMFFLGIDMLNSVRSRYLRGIREDAVAVATDVHGFLKGRG